jgi:hypothetical protein
MIGAPDASLMDTLLLLAFRHRFTAPDLDSGLDLLTRCGGVRADAESWRAAIAAALADGYIYDPVRLPPGALQCHWHLELTPAGAARARHLRGTNGEAG